MCLDTHQQEATVCFYLNAAKGNKEKMLHRFLLLRSFCCCISLERGCSLIGAFEWVLTVYLSCRYYDLSNVGCNKGFKISCSQIYYNVLSFVVSAAIVSGINKKSPMYFIPWLIIKTVEYAVYTVIMIYDLQARFLPNSEIVLPLIFALVTIFVFWYSWLCVLSLYFNMGHSSNQGDQDDSQLQELV